MAAIFDADADIRSRLTALGSAALVNAPVAYDLRQEVLAVVCAAGFVDRVHRTELRRHAREEFLQSAFVVVDDPAPGVLTKPLAEPTANHRGYGLGPLVEMDGSQHSLKGTGQDARLLWATVTLLTLAQ